MFDSLVDFLKNNIDQLKGHEVEISSEFKEHHNEDSKYIIKNWLFSSPEFRKWRITRLDGGKKLQVFNTVAYPDFDSETDCFVEEFESFLEAKNCALEKCIYIRDMAASQVRFFRSLRNVSFVDELSGKGR